MCTGDLFEARFLAIPRARCLLGHSYPLPSRTELSCGPLCGRLGLPGWAGTLRPGAPGGAGVPKPQPRPLLSGRRRQPERRRRRRGVPRARLTCGRREGRSRAFLHRDRPAAGQASSPILPARRPPRRLHSAAAASSPPSAGARGHRGPSDSRPRAPLRPSPPSPSGPRGWSGAPSPPPNSGTRSSRGR